MAKSPASGGNSLHAAFPSPLSNKTASAAPSALDILQEADFTKPFEAFARKLPDSNSSNLPLQTQRAQFSRALGELLPEIQLIRASIPKWRQAVLEVPGIQRNTSEQMQRLENLNYAVTRRSELLQRHKAILSADGAAAPDVLSSRNGDLGTKLAKNSSNSKK